MIAFLSDGVPPAAVYLVRPLLIATIAASLMNCGVSKSGSPAPMLITSLPSAFRRAALADTARVGEGLMAFRRWATRDMTAPEGVWRLERGETPPFYLLKLTVHLAPHTSHLRPPTSFSWTSSPSPAAPFASIGP